MSILKRLVRSAGPLLTLGLCSQRHFSRRNKPLLCGMVICTMVLARRSHMPK